MKHKETEKSIATPTQKGPPWRIVFENVLLIAFKKLMNEYRAWGIGQMDIKFDNKTRPLREISHQVFY